MLQRRLELDDVVIARVSANLVATQALVQRVLALSKLDMTKQVGASLIPTLPLFQRAYAAF